MSSKSRRRRLRKSKQQTTSNPVQQNYANKFMRFEAKYLCTLLLSGYIHQIKDHMNAVISVDIELLCKRYFGRNLQTIELDSQIPAITKIKYETQPPSKRIKDPEQGNKKRSRRRWVNIEDPDYLQRQHNGRLIVLYCKIKLNDTFNSLQSYQKCLVLRRICLEKRSDTMRWPVHELILSNCPNSSANKQLYYMEYILWIKYKTLQKIDLSNMNLTDEHIVYFCNAIENILAFYRKDAQIARNKNIPNQPQIKKIFKNKNVNNIVLRLQELNLSLNANITNKNIALLLRNVKKNLPHLNALYLSSTNVTNKVVGIIMKYNIHGLLVHLTDCKNVTLDALKGHPRSDYEDDIPTQYIYCKNLIYYANENEYQWHQKIKKQGQYQAGKGKKYIANAKRNVHSTIAGETDSLSWTGCY